MRIRYRIVAFVIFVALAMTGCTAVVPAVAGSAAVQELTGEQHVSGEVLKFDLAEDFTRFVFDPDIVHEEGFPVSGDTFITQGYLYPVGTLDGANGVNADGSPQFPDKVIGTWICRGWVLSDNMGSDGGPVAISTQFFQLGDKYGNQTIVTEGYEYMQPDLPLIRAITGGTGEYRSARGEQMQELLGVNEYMGMSMRFELHLEQ